MQLTSKRIRKFLLLNNTEFLAYKVDPTNDLEVLTYEESRISRFAGKSENVAELVKRGKELKEDINKFYDNRTNWVTVSEALTMIRKAIGPTTCNKRTIRNYFNKGYIRGMRDHKRQDFLIKLCKRDVEDMIEDAGGDKSEQ